MVPSAPGCPRSRGSSARTAAGCATTPWAPSGCGCRTWVATGATGSPSPTKASGRAKRSCRCWCSTTQRPRPASWWATAWAKANDDLPPHFIAFHSLNHHKRDFFIKSFSLNLISFNIIVDTSSRELSGGKPCWASWHRTMRLGRTFGATFAKRFLRGEWNSWGEEHSGAMAKIGHFTWAANVSLTKFTKSKFAPYPGRSASALSSLSSMR